MSQTVRRDREEPSQEGAKAFPASQEAVGAFACPEGEGASGEDSSSSRMRGKVGLLRAHQMPLVTLDARLSRGVLYE